MFDVDPSRRSFYWTCNCITSRASSLSEIYILVYKRLAPLPLLTFKKFMYRLIWRNGKVCNALLMDALNLGGSEKRRIWTVVRVDFWTEDEEMGLLNGRCKEWRDRDREQNLEKNHIWGFAALFRGELLLLMISITFRLTQAVFCGLPAECYMWPVWQKEVEAATDKTREISWNTNQGWHFQMSGFLNRKNVLIK